MVVAVLMLGGCSAEERQRRADASHELETATRYGIAVGALGSTVLAVRRRREAAAGGAALGIVARAPGSLLCMAAGVLASMFATMLIWPRDVFSYRPLDSPHPSSLLLGAVFIRPFQGGAVVSDRPT